MKKLLLCLLVLAVSIGSWAQQFTSGVWKYTLSGGNATIVGTTLTSGTDLNIPSTVDGYTVTAIGDMAFFQRSGFTGSLTIPPTVTSIGKLAFQGCSGFTGSLIIPGSVKSIGEEAFGNCRGFKGALVISEGVTSIGEKAFYYCSGFTGSLTIPEGVTNIGKSAFQGCSRFNGSLTIPASVTSIGENVFMGCSYLTGSLTIPGSVKSIGNLAFNGCSRFTGSLTIPASVTSIGRQAFENCSGFTGSLTIPASVTSIGLGAFNGCYGFTGSLVIPASVTSIEEITFSGCRGFTGSLVIPTTVTSIGASSFSGCSGLTGSLVIPTSVTSIANYAFQYNSALQSVTFASTGNITLGSQLFGYCSELRYIDASALPTSTGVSVRIFPTVPSTLGDSLNVAVTFGKEDYTLLYLPAGSKLSSTSTTANVIIGDACKDLKLYESNGIGAKGYGTYGYEYGTSVIKPFTATSAVYTGKSLTDDGVYTLYLPYDIDLPNNVEAYGLSSYASKQAFFTKHTGTLKAYTPYLLKRVEGSGTQTLDNRTMANVAVKMAPDYLTNSNAGTITDTNTGTWKFLGTTNPISNADAEANRLYVLEADNTWRPVKSVNSAGYVRSLRAFLQAPAGYSGAPVVFMLDEEDTTTGLETIEAEVKKENVDIYTVEGRFVGRNYESLPSGLYIIGGKKVYKF